MTALEVTLTLAQYDLLRGATVPEMHEAVITCEYGRITDGITPADVLGTFWDVYIDGRWLQMHMLELITVSRIPY